jgi:hypothetical protein
LNSSYAADLLIASSAGLGPGSNSDSVASASMQSVDPAAVFPESAAPDSAMDTGSDAASLASVDPGDAYPNSSAGEESDAASLCSVNADDVYSDLESEGHSDDGSLGSVHPCSVYSDSGTEPLSHIHSLPSVDAMDAFTANEAEPPSDSASFPSVRAGAAFSQASSSPLGTPLAVFEARGPLPAQSSPHLPAFSLQMQDMSDSSSLHPVQAADASSAGSSLPIGTDLQFETRGPFTASSFAYIPSNWLNLDAFDEDPDAAASSGADD